MPDLTNTSIGANYRQQIVPFSRFGTRKIAWYRVGRGDTNSGGSLDMVLFNKLIDGIQTKGEIVTVGAPYISNSWGKFIVGLFEDTLNNGNEELTTEAGQNDMAESIQDTLRAIADDNDINVERIYMYGAPQTGGNGDPSDGWATDSNYAEPDFKSDFLNGYTQD